MPEMRLDHLSFLVRDLDAAIEKWRGILRVLDPGQAERITYGAGVEGGEEMRWATFVNPNGCSIQLFEPVGEGFLKKILDKRGEGGFDLHDVELATVFARQATVAIRSSRVERDTAILLRAVLVTADRAPDELDSIIAAEIRSLDADGDDPLWALADQIALLRAADPSQLELVRDLLAVLVRRADRGRSARGR